MKNNVCFFLFISVMNILGVCAQQVKISATVIDVKNAPIEYANIQLLNQDSVFITGTVSTQEGKMELRATANRDYWLSFSAVGYESKAIYLRGINARTDLGNIVLEESTVALGDVTITANQVVRQIDRQIAFPNALQYKSSNNALEVLRNMSLPKLKVDVVQKAITLMDGGSTEVRINGIPATINQVYALQSHDIIRIEYYDNPGVRFQSDAVIDFIVKRRSYGGNISTNLLNSPHVGMGDDLFSARFNYRNSEWAANYNVSYRSYKKRWLEENTTYHFPDQTIIKKEEGIPAPFNYQIHNVNVSYNYTLADKRILNVVGSGSISRQNQYYESFNYYSNNNSIKNHAFRDSKIKEKNPTLDFYYKEILSNSQNIQFNIVGGYDNSDYNRNYTETNLETNFLSESRSIVEGNKYFAIGQVNHEKRWAHVVLSTGVKYQYGYTENAYSGTITENTMLKNNDLYLYTQLNGQWKKLYYSLGIGASYFYFNDNQNKTHYWTFRPVASLYYELIKNLSFQYVFSTNSFNPSLSQLSEVYQNVNQWEMIKGNPGLKPYRNYYNQLGIYYQRNRIQYYLNIGYQYMKNIIVQETYFDEFMGKFVSMGRNQKYFQALSGMGSINWQVIPDILSLNIYGNIVRYANKGTNFYHTYMGYFYGGQANFNYNNWRCFLNLGSRNKSLLGETKQYGELSSYAEVGYKYKNVYLGACIWSFLENNWSSGQENLSDVINRTSWTYISDSAPAFSLRLTWDFAWGRKSKAGRKELDNKDTDTGILKANE